MCAEFTEESTISLETSDTGDEVEDMLEKGGWACCVVVSGEDKELFVWIEIRVEAKEGAGRMKKKRREQYISVACVMLISLSSLACATMRGIVHRVMPSIGRWVLEELGSEGSRKGCILDV